MPTYNFKSIQVVPGANDFIDVVLSKTNRKTPTVIHKGYAISRIRTFYMRKIKYTMQNFHEKLSKILEDFPILDEIHPFYADLMNVLYDRDHYKLALGQLSNCRHFIDNLAKDYLRLLKYGDSLYRCKQLKRACLGRMCTLMKKQGPSLAYLEQVRQHLSRLPSIDPNSKTLLLCGYPNVGKSSFINKITRADVEVQPYAFTTKSLYVGHFDYQYSRWQCIDTPGILDHPLEDRNTIEMQSITALAHLRASILYIVDISEQCGYTLEQQLSLFESIKPLFTNKPLVLVANKTDVIKLEDLDDYKKSLISRVEEENNIKIIPMSTITEFGIVDVKEKACNQLIEQRVQVKMKGKQVQNVLNRLHVSVPAPRDNKERPVTIPQEALEKKIKQLNAIKVEEQKEIVFNWGVKMDEIDPDFNPRAFGEDFKKEYLLANDEWKYDKIPELLDGKNIADYVDPDILEMLDRLEEEEEERMKELENEMDDEDEIELTEEQKALHKEVTKVKNETIMKSRMKKTLNSTPLSGKRKSLKDFEKHLEDMGIDPSEASNYVRSNSKSKSRSVSRGRSLTKEKLSGEKRKRSTSLTPGGSLKSAKMMKLTEKLERHAQKERNTDARRGEADRVNYPTKVKHLLSGKRKSGTHDRR